MGNYLQVVTALLRSLQKLGPSMRSLQNLLPRFIAAMELASHQASCHAATKEPS
jgi:hypothetical protein